jgi:hypothetical protein
MLISSRSVYLPPGLFLLGWRDAAESPVISWANGLCLGWASAAPLVQECDYLGQTSRVEPARQSIRGGEDHILAEEILTEIVRVRTNCSTLVGSPSVGHSVIEAGHQPPTS